MGKLTEKTEGLKPCPFCGGQAVLTEAMGEAWVNCLYCSASSRMMSTRESAAERWNSRAPVKQSLLPPFNCIVCGLLFDQVTNLVQHLEHHYKNDG